MPSRTTQALADDPAAPPRADSSFVKLPTEIIRDKTLSDSAKVLYAEICTYAWESVGNGCYASQPRMADELGWSPRKVQRVAEELLLAGRVTRQLTGRTNIYHPCRICPDADDGSESTSVTDQMRHRRRTKKTKYNQTKRTQIEGKGARVRAPDPPTPKEGDIREDGKIFHRGGWFYVRELRELEERQTNERLRETVLRRNGLSEEDVDEAALRVMMQNPASTDGKLEASRARARAASQKIEREERLHRDMEACARVMNGTDS